MQKPRPFRNGARVPKVYQKGNKKASKTMFSRLPYGAGYEIRTRDFHLGKVTLYH